MPKIFTIPVTKEPVKEKMLGYDYYSLVVPVATLPTDIPGYPNVRQANPKASICDEIFHTLIATPENFIQYNRGIAITAKSARGYKEKGQYKIDIEILEPSEGYDCYGVCNGGHTLKAIEKAQSKKLNLEDANVTLVIYAEIENEQNAKNIALYSNTSMPVDRRSKVHAAGGFDEMKAFCNQHKTLEGKSFSHISYYQNAEDDKHKQCSANHILKIINSLDCKKFNHAIPGTPHPKGISSMSAKQIEHLNGLLPLLPYAFWIEKRLYNEIDKHLKSQQMNGISTLASVSINKKGDFTKLADGSTYGFKASETIALPIVAAYRVLLHSNYEWMLPFEQFREPLFQLLCKRFFKELKDLKLNGNNSGIAIQRCDKLWNNLCGISIGYRDELLLQSQQKDEIRIAELVLSNR